MARDLILSTFEQFRSELDEQNDRRERLVKISRDITIHSKRAIFLLHRLASDEYSAAIREAEQKAASEAMEKLEAVRPMFQIISDELVGQEQGRFDQAISPGLQEFIEALSFAHYLAHGTLITFDQVQAWLCPSGVPYFILSHSDYLLGLSDLTGELMRFAITAISIRGGRDKASEISHFVRSCSGDFEALTPYIRGLSKKQQVTNESLKKIELAAYGVAVRGSEHTGLHYDPRLDGGRLREEHDRSGLDVDDAGDWY